MSNNLPSISSYGNYSNGNYGINTLCVSFDGFRLFYSYKTIVAYSDPVDGLVVRQNDWRTTTGKHLNWIDDGDKKSRLPGEEFQAKLQAMLARHTS